MHEFKIKNLLGIGKVADVFSAPAVFVLTITLPVMVKVMVRPYDSLGYCHERTPNLTPKTLLHADGQK
jgi:hypothetical protein